jgi:hypothetical protein
VCYVNIKSELIIAAPPGPMITIAGLPGGAPLPGSSAGAGREKARGMALG